ncbi:MAG: two-component system sensor histidine kinase NtrB, partial [Nitrospiria bacterium]
FSPRCTHLTFLGARDPAVVFQRGILGAMRLWGGATERIENLLRLALFLFVVFLVLFNLHTWLQLKSVKDQSELELNERLILATGMVAQELDLRFSGLHVEPAQLLSLKERIGVEQISLLDREYRSLGDSSPAIKRGVLYNLSGIDPSTLEKVWSASDGGEIHLSSVYQEESGRPVKAAFSPLKDFSSREHGILRVTVILAGGEGGGAGTVTGLLLRIFVGVGAAALVYSGIRSLVFTQRKKIGREGTNSRGPEGVEPGRKDTADFVIDTFQTLIQRLKEKEQELERHRRIAEERADHIESYNENILRSVSSGVITFNQKEVITTFNLAAERILGLSGAAVIGRSCSDVFGRDSRIYCLVQNALIRKEVTVRQELELVREQGADGGQTRHRWEKIWVGVSTSLLMDRQDQVIGTTMVFTDISEIKRLQEQMELKKRLSMLGEMSAGIAHEFRNYMGTILGYAKLLVKKVGTTHAATGMIQAIIRELEAMEQLINELLGFSRHTELNLQPVDLRTLIERVVHQVFEQAMGPLPKLTLSLSPQLGKVQVDEVLIRQALGNMIKNALEAMPSGGELRVQAALKDYPSQVGRWVDGSWKNAAEGKEVEVEIQDTGIGIPPEILDKIFLPFFTTKEKGTGLGLALVHKIILSHNGQIQVDSQEGRGTTFRVYLPVMS